MSINKLLTNGNEYLLMIASLPFSNKPSVTSSLIQMNMNTH
jgi:hypothetical protein